MTPRLRANDALLEVSKLDFGAVLQLYSAETPNGAPLDSHRVN